MSVDVLFTVGLLVVSEIFPPNTQALAGAVFNTCAQFGTAIGLAIIGVVTDVVTQQSDYADKTSPAALLTGYHAGFWTAFAGMVLSCAIGLVGLRQCGKVGLKKD